VVKVDNSLTPSNDVVNVTGALAHGGTLTATKIGAGPLAMGDQFQIFPAGSRGSLAVLGTPGTGLQWSFAPASGILSVVNAVVQPPTLEVSRSGNNLTFSWAQPGFKLQSQTNAFGVGVPPNWSGCPNGGTSPVGVTINPANPSVFFRLISQ
jgi:hypothetical protein